MPKPGRRTTRVVGAVGATAGVMGAVVAPVTPAAAAVVGYSYCVPNTSVQVSSSVNNAPGTPYRLEVRASTRAWTNGGCFGSPAAVQVQAGGAYYHNDVLCGSLPTHIGGAYAESYVRLKILCGSGQYKNMGSHYKDGGFAHYDATPYITVT